MSEPAPFFIGKARKDGRIDFDFPSQVTAYVRRKFSGKFVEVEIRELHDKRSDRQNRGFHAMIAPWAKSAGWDVGELKRALLVQVFGTREVVSPITGEVTEAPQEPHTSTLTVSQFSELIERTLDIAAECGEILIAPDEYRRAKEAAQKKQARQKAKEAA